MYAINEIIEHEVAQRSDAWFALRDGRLTGSHFNEVVPSKKARQPWTEAQIKVLYRVAAEILTGKAERKHFVSDAMQWGIDHEEEAIEAFCVEMLFNYRECGIFQAGDYIASSPDAIIGENQYTLEIKCPSSAVHLMYYKDPSKLWEAYKWQVLGEFLCTGIGKGFIASYDPRFPKGKQLVIYEPVDFEDDRNILKNRLIEVEEKIKELIA